MTLQALYWHSFESWPAPITIVTNFMIGAKKSELAATVGADVTCIGIDLPPNFPDPINIVGCIVGLGNSKATNQGETHFFLDPEGKYFHGSTPPGQETSLDWHRMLTLSRMGSVPPVWQPQDQQWYPSPIEFNRANGDKLSLEVMPAPYFDWAFFNLFYNVSPKP
jgi:hypothetical protein